MALLWISQRCSQSLSSRFIYGFVVCFILASFHLMVVHSVMLVRDAHYNASRKGDISPDSSQNPEAGFIEAKTPKGYTGATYHMYTNETADHVYCSTYNTSFMYEKESGELRVTAFTKSMLSGQEDFKCGTCLKITNLHPSGKMAIVRVVDHGGALGLDLSKEAFDAIDDNDKNGYKLGHMPNGVHYQELPECPSSFVSLAPRSVDVLLFFGTSSAIVLGLVSSLVGNSLGMM